MDGVIAAAGDEVVVAGAAGQDVVPGASEHIAAAVAQGQLIVEVGAVNRLDRGQQIVACGRSAGAARLQVDDHSGRGIFVKHHIAPRATIDGIVARTWPEPVCPSVPDQDVAVCRAIDRFDPDQRIGAAEPVACSPEREIDVDARGGVRIIGSVDERPVGPAIQDVVTCVAPQKVITVSTDDHVVAAGSNKCVVARSAIDLHTSP